MNNIIRQHYVWRKYLRPWTTNGKIWCMRDGKTFNPAIEKIAQEKYFYYIDDLNNIEVDFIESFIMRLHPTSHALLSTIMSMYIINGKSSEFAKRNNLEKFHSVIENNTCSILDNLYKKDLGWMEDNNTKIDFSRYIGHQYTRTKKMQYALKTSFDEAVVMHKDIKGIDSLKISKALSLIIAESIGNWVYSNTRISFIVNRSRYGFLTCDQPVFNLIKDNVDELGVPTGLKLYYPITPKIALIISNDKTIDTEVDEKEVGVYNSFIKNIQYNMIFSKSRDQLLLN